MFIDKPGKISDRILMLGRKESWVYLLNGGAQYALLGGGMMHILPEVLDQMAAFDVEEGKIGRLLILHSHFDHCGLISFLKRRWPWAEITGSLRAKELLSTPKVAETSEFLNRFLLEKYHRKELSNTYDQLFGGIEVSRTVADGEVLWCGDRRMEIIAVPGHSSCSIAVYVPEEKAMFASDAGGIPMGDRIFTAANSDFDKYMKSLGKMAAYPMEMFLPEHCGALIGPECLDYFDRSFASAKETRRVLEKALAEMGDAEKATRYVTDTMTAQAEEEILPKEVVELVVGQMMRWLSKRKQS